tara:strand:- start:331 stop:1083 length:753 start_codon:yes stop_codon:yes gene_type:complete
MSLTIEPMGGLANRLRVIIAGITLCKYLGTSLKINWMHDQKHCHELRAKEISGQHFLEVFEPLGSVGGVDISFISKNESADRGNSSTFYRGTDVNFARDIVQDFNVKFPLFYKVLKPTMPLKEKIDSLSVAYAPYHAVHIRRTDHVDWLKRNNLEFSPLERFEDFIARAIDKKVFLATDCKETQNLLSEKYGDQMLFHNSPHLPESRGARTTNLQGAVLDIFSCANSQKFLGTKLSSFSGLIQTLRTINE